MPFMNMWTARVVYEGTVNTKSGKELPAASAGRASIHQTPSQVLEFEQLPRPDELNSPTSCRSHNPAVCK